MNLSNLQLDKQKKILVVIICSLIIYIDFTFILKSQTSGINSLNPKITKLKNELTNFNRNLDNMRASQGKQSLATQKAIIMSSKIIAADQIPGLLQDISSQANKLDIKIGQIRPSRETINVKNVVAGNKFTLILINLDLTCDYHNLGKFINELENSQVFLGVQELKISTQLPDYMKQKVALVLKTYVTK
ncbi:MAG: type 4a pilus biogenesis protein PilO [Candidatus Omnitrophica bacterium]|nr:type 4a pilus biogenesis protein PilO [Candidatus Omnitrophota bacterium]MDO9572767.1 type 4a pilus biogenesis protein PilO [Candidatus Omnitrophota bacterium]